MDIPSPASMSGIALFKELLKLFILPTESFSIKENTSIGFLSWINKINDPTNNAIIKPIKKE